MSLILQAPPCLSGLLVLCGVNTASVDVSQGNARAPCCELSEELTFFAKGSL